MTEPCTVCADMALADALGVDVFYTRPLYRHGVRSLEEMRGWTVSELYDVRGVGSARLLVLAEALKRLELLAEGAGSAVRGMVAR